MMRNKWVSFSDIFLVITGPECDLDCLSTWGALSVGLLVHEWRPLPACTVTSETFSGPGGGCLPCSMEQSSLEPSLLWPGAPQPSCPPRAACRRSPSAAWCWGWSCSSWGFSGLWTVKVPRTTTPRSLTQSVHIIHILMTFPTSAAMPSSHQGAASQNPSLCFCPGGWTKTLSMSVINFRIWSQDTSLQLWCVVLDFLHQQQR